MPNTGGVAASHIGDSAPFWRAEGKAADMLRVRQYIPLVALAFGFIITTVWIALMSWLPVQFIMGAAVKVFTDFQL